MTTIVWDGKTLAADRQTSADGSVYRYACKILEVPGGFVACCGSVSHGWRLVKWLRDGSQGEFEAPAEELGAISVINGEVCLWEGGFPMPIEADAKFAIGSGAQWAMAAMDFGKNAVKAVEYAATRDNGTGGGVDVVTITQQRRKPARKG